ncbi:ubiquitin fusion degradation protein UFD1-domain-containing protein [Gongronella butleri]|nr:ubiquitin fusion degradation protein UFD1-domain-containing protein [Gongronella butleri]
MVNPNNEFAEFYRCYPVAMMPNGDERDNNNYSGKIFLPQSALEKLSHMNISYPMLFRLINASQARHTHAGVLEFVAEEGRAYLPQWMMRTLGLEPGQLLEIKNTTLALGSFVRIQPQSTNFLDISDPKAVLENALRNFSTLTLGDVIEINYNNKIYEIKVLDVKPHFEEHGGISIVETDLEVDFAPPVGYTEPTASIPKSTIKSKMPMEHLEATSTKPTSSFQGAGQSLRGNKGKDVAKANGSSSSSTSTPQGNRADAAALDPSVTFDPEDDGPLNLPFGQLYFGYQVIPPKSADDTEKDKEKSFGGAGKSLRTTKAKS